MSARYADMIVHEVGTGDAACPAPKRETRPAARRCPRRQAEIPGWFGIAQSEQVRFEAYVGGEFALAISPLALYRRAPAKKTPRPREASVDQLFFRLKSS